MELNQRVTGPSSMTSRNDVYADAMSMEALGGCGPHGQCLHQQATLSIGVWGRRSLRAQSPRHPKRCSARLIQQAWAAWGLGLGAGGRERRVGGPGWNPGTLPSPCTSLPPSTSIKSQLYLAVYVVNAAYSGATEPCTTPVATYSAEDLKRLLEQEPDCFL